MRLAENIYMRNVYVRDALFGQFINRLTDAVAWGRSKTAIDQNGQKPDQNGVQTLRTQDTSDPRHFGPRTLRTQDISAPVPKCPKDTSAPVPKCPGSEVS